MRAAQFPVHGIEMPTSWSPQSRRVNEFAAMGLVRVVPPRDRDQRLVKISELVPYTMTDLGSAN